MGHNISFLTRVANNVIYVLDASQFNRLKVLAAAQMEQIDLYGYKRFPLIALVIGALFAAAACDDQMGSPTTPSPFSLGTTAEFTGSRR